jgi:uncharacterized OB-fold protein
MQPKLTIKEFTEALKEKKLLGLKCLDCGATNTPPRMVCQKCCGARLEVVELSGKGKIVTFTCIHVPPESRQGQQPYLVIMVELEEGPWLMANLSGIETDTASMELIDKKVRMIAPLLPVEKRPETGVAPLFILEA